ncbi:MAG: hypothetical protein ACRD04_00395 [Terriglobales bacterium]
MQRGMGSRSLCPSCNNNTGAWFNPAPSRRTPSRTSPFRYGSNIANDRRAHSTIELAQVLVRDGKAEAVFAHFARR